LLLRDGGWTPKVCLQATRCNSKRLKAEAPQKAKLEGLSNNFVAGRPNSDEEIGPQSGVESITAFHHLKELPFWDVNFVFVEKTLSTIFPAGQTMEEFCAEHFVSAFSS
jgi:hypothetical protein